MEIELPIMKHPIHLAAIALGLALSATMASSCSHKDKVKENTLLQHIVEEESKMLPMKMGELLNLEKVWAHGDTIFYQSTLGEEVADMLWETLSSGRDQEIKASLMDMLVNQAQDGIDLFIKQKIVVAYEYHFPGHKEPKRIIINSKELEDYINSTMQLDDDGRVFDYIDQQAESFKASLPLQVDEATILKSMSRKDKTIVYEYEIVEEEVSIGELKKNLKAQRAVLLEQFVANVPPIVKAQYKKAGIVVVYSYTGDKSGETLTLTIEPSEY